MVQQGGTKYSYDVDGYLASGSYVIDCRYSAQGELLSAATAAGQSIAYSYDGMARRVARHDQTGAYQYFYTNPDQPFQLSAVRDPDGTFTAYYYDPYGSLFAFKRGASTYYVASDHLGTPRIIADSDGAVVDVMEYDSYGSLLSDTNPTFKLPIGFAGGIVDITGLIRFGYRDYEPASGRWANRDPILYKSEEFNLYQYVQNDPVNFLDRAGLQQNSACENDDCWKKCLAEDPLFPYVAPFSILPAVNLKLPGEMRAGASRFTSVDRRLPSWTGANPNAGATVTRGSAGRIKFIGRYGTAAAAIGTFATSYSATAMLRCLAECEE